MNAKPKETLEGLLDSLGFPSTVVETHMDDAIFLEIQTEDSGRLIGRQGQTLSQLQYVVNRLLFKQDRNVPKVTLDVGNYRLKSRDSLVESSSCRR